MAKGRSEMLLAIPARVRMAPLGFCSLALFHNHGVDTTMRLSSSGTMRTPTCPISLSNSLRPGAPEVPLEGTHIAPAVGPNDPSGFGTYAIGEVLQIARLLKVLR